MTPQIVAWCGLVFGALLSASAHAAPVKLSPTATGMSSTADRMISYRFQERTWQTSDGGFHVLINRGSLSAPASLVLYSSYDNGVTWTAAASISNTSAISTADGYLAENDLTLVYSTATASVAFGVYRYDPGTRKWTRQRTDTVFKDSTAQGLSPAVAVDALGALWCAYVKQDKATRNAVIRLATRPVPTAPWADSGLTFGEVDNTSIQRSARPIPIPGGMGLLYTVHEKISWATRSNGASAGTPWESSTLFVSQPPYDDDPWGGHFSMLSDAANNLHLVTPDHGQGVYFRFDYATQQWQSPLVIAGSSNVGYVQIGLIDGTLAMILNSSLRGQVYQSGDLGLNWTNTHTLTHPLPTGTISYVPPRLEMAGSSTGPAPVLQLYVDGSLFRLMRFSVPALQ